MPDLHGDFARRVESSLDIASATETVWLTARPASAVRQKLKVGQLEALYESVFLRIFTTWESYIEDVLVRYLAGFDSPTHTPQAVAGKRCAKSISEAKNWLYNGKSYLLWHNPKSAADRCAKWLLNCPVEQALRANQPALENYASIRHRIAHSTEDSKKSFTSGALMISGSKPSGSPGKFLRDRKIDDPLNQTAWIRVISEDLVDIAEAMTL